MPRRPNYRKVRCHQVYTVAEAAEELAVDRQTVRRWVRDCGLPAAIDQKPWLIDGRDLKRFLEDRCRASKRPLGPGEFYCLPWRHMRELQAAGDQVYSELKNLVVWRKSNGGMGSFYRSQHELVFVYKVGTAAHTNTFGLGDTGRYRTNVMEYPGVNSFGPNQSDLALHPTVKPVALVADAIKDASRRGEIVLDGFGGSGTTLVAAERTGRIARLVELDPHYCDVICRRFEAFTGASAQLAETGESFADAAAQRMIEAAEANGEAAL